MFVFVAQNNQFSVDNYVVALTDTIINAIVIYTYVTFNMWLEYIC